MCLNSRSCCRPPSDSTLCLRPASIGLFRREGDMCNDVINQTYCLVAATLAASLQPKDHQDAVAKYRQVLTELRKDGLLTYPTETRSAHYAALRGQMQA